MMEKQEDIQRLRETFVYDPESGVLLWRDRDRNLSGKPAGSVDAKNGYARVRFQGRLYLSHRIALAMDQGRWPEGEVDHINGNRSDNRIENLRDVSKSENLRNKAQYASNTSGVTGVHWHKQHRKWCASIMSDGKRRVIGIFQKLECAIAA